MSENDGWAIIYSKKFPSIQDILPLGDLIVHQPGLKCECHPRKVRIDSNQHTVAVQIAHKALDGRA